ncbi:Thiamin pyrophosphokinase [Ralstonia solanacearum UW551]|uniref:Nucleoside diphosphate hydrolase protein n=3 Tax=Ralstonia solanacearum TaxID=305 RepID=A0ABF7RBX9_RALSL|nr:Thiamin pyrophosphokinase [Ralstonia solanacearum UW551]CEJ18879.1 nucleoside diphosphate hydrolase protein [Ralstonia solanacearum IPO1609]
MIDSRVQRVAMGLAARNRFDAGVLRPWIVSGQAVGWLDHERAALLTRWPQWFEVGAGQVDLRDTLDTAAARTAALAEVIARLADDGHIRGWRDERFTVDTGWGTPPLALIERAAARFFGIRTYAAHMNGIIDAPEATLWLARRAESKPIDPGMWDNLVAGGIGHGFDARSALRKECWEEAGIDAGLAAGLVERGTLDVLRAAPEGIQNETLFVFDLTLPAGFLPVNQDGEVVGHLRASVDTALDIMADCAMTVDATLVTLDALQRLVPQRFAPDNNR